MFLIDYRTSFVSKMLAPLLSAAIVLAALAPPVAGGASQGEKIYEKWDEISSLRMNGEFDRAIEILNQIIKEYSNSEDILRQAYNQLIFTFILKKDEAGAMERAREALERFHDLEADPLVFHPKVNNMYEKLRKQMFGSLTITKPRGCRVFLNGEHRGETPLQLDLVRVGEYDLTLTKSGYRDYSERIRVEPSGKHNFEISMDRERDKKWWLYRVGPVVITGVLLAVGLRGEKGVAPPEEEEPLPPPPPPPAR